MGAALAGLCVVGFCFKLILDADEILGDSNVSVVEGGAEQARTTGLTPVGVSPASDARREDKSLSEISRRVAVIAFTVGISAVIFGLAGICTAKIKKCPCTCVFGTFSLILTLTYAFAAFVLLSIYYVTDEQLTDFCNDELNLDGTEGLIKRMVEEAEDYVFTVDTELKKAVNTYMCTDFCPCEGGWDYDIYGTPVGKSFDDHLNNEFNFDGDQTIFTNCFAERKTLWLQQDPDVDPVDEEVINLIKTLEEDFNCSGFCSYARFWASKDIKTGPPTQACIYTLKESFDDDMVLLGWSIVATGAMTLLLLCCHCGLYLNRSVPGKSGVSKKRFIFD